jgi:hypothetical protein
MDALIETCAEIIDSKIKNIYGYSGFCGVKRVHNFDECFPIG